MKDLFPGYYRLTDDEFKQLWKNAIFAFDANILLYLYRSSPDTRNDFLNVLKQLDNRIWLPHQAALEYQRNRAKVIDDLLKAYTLSIEKVPKPEKPIIKVDDIQRHPFLEAKDLQNKISAAFVEYQKALAEIEKHLKFLKKSHPDWHHNDSIREEIDALFVGKVGQKYSEERLNKIYEVGAARYESKQPPGYEDIKDKPGNRKYGDLVLWFQLLDYATENKTPMIFVTDDRKEDWWSGDRGNTAGPRPELLQEFFDKTAQQLYLYRPKPFLDFAEKYLLLRTAQTSREEIQAIGDVEEERTRIEDLRKETEAFRLDLDFLKQMREEAVVNIVDRFEAMNALHAGIDLASQIEPPIVNFTDELETMSALRAGVDLESLLESPSIKLADELEAMNALHASIDVASQIEPPIVNFTDELETMSALRAGVDLESLLESPSIKLADELEAMNAFHAGIDVASQMEPPIVNFMDELGVSLSHSDSEIISKEALELEFDISSKLASGLVEQNLEESETTDNQFQPSRSDDFSSTHPNKDEENQVL